MAIYSQTNLEPQSPRNGTFNRSGVLTFSGIVTVVPVYRNGSTLHNAVIYYTNPQPFPATRDNVTVGLAPGCNELDAGSAIDSSSSAGATITSSVEAGISSDTISAIKAAVSSVSDTASGIDAQSSIKITSSSVTDSATAADTLASVQLPSAASIVDAGSASDALDATRTLPIPESEAVSAIDFVSAVGMIGSAQSDISISADSLSVINTTGASGADSATAADTLASVQLPSAASIVDAGSASDALDATRTLPIPESEAVSAIDFVSAVGMIGSAQSDISISADSLSVINTTGASGADSGASADIVSGMASDSSAIGNTVTAIDTGIGIATSSAAACEGNAVRDGRYLHNYVVNYGFTYVSAVDMASGVVPIFGANIEPLSATDLIQVTTSFVPFGTETANSIESSWATFSTASSVAEAGAAIEIETSSVSFLDAGSEATASADSVNAFPVYAVVEIEIGAATEVEIAKSDIVGTSVDTASSADSLVATKVTASAIVDVVTSIEVNSAVNSGTAVIIEAAVAIDGATAVFTASGIIAESFALHDGAFIFNGAITNRGGQPLSIDSSDGRLATVCVQVDVSSSSETSSAIFSGLTACVEPGTSTELSSALLLANAASSGSTISIEAISGGILSSAVTQDGATPNEVVNATALALSDIIDPCVSVDSNSGGAGLLASVADTVVASSAQAASFIAVGDSISIAASGDTGSAITTGYSSSIVSNSLRDGSYLHNSTIFYGVGQDISSAGLVAYSAESDAVAAIEQGVATTTLIASSIDAAVASDSSLSLGWVSGYMAEIGVGSDTESAQEVTAVNETEAAAPADASAGAYSALSSLNEISGSVESIFGVGTTASSQSEVSALLGIENAFSEQYSSEIEQATSTESITSGVASLALVIEGAVMRDGSAFFNSQISLRGVQQISSESTSSMLQAFSAQLNVSVASDSISNNFSTLVTSANAGAAIDELSALSNIAADETDSVSGIDSNAAQSNRLTSIAETAAPAELNESVCTLSVTEVEANVTSDLLQSSISTTSLQADAGIANDQLDQSIRASRATNDAVVASESMAAVVFCAPLISELSNLSDFSSVSSLNLSVVNEPSIERNGGFLHDGTLFYVGTLQNNARELAGASLNILTGEIESVGPVDLSSAIELSVASITDAGTSSTAQSLTASSLAMQEDVIFASDVSLGIQLAVMTMEESPVFRDGGYLHDGSLSYWSGQEFVSADVNYSAVNAESAIAAESAGVLLAAFRASSDVTTSTEVSSGILDAMVAAADATVAIESNSAAAFVSGSATETLFLRDGRYAHDGLLTYSTELDIASGGVNYSAVEIESVGPVDLSSAIELSVASITDAGTSSTAQSLTASSLAMQEDVIFASDVSLGIQLAVMTMEESPVFRDGGYLHDGSLSYWSGQEFVSADVNYSAVNAESAIAAESAGVLLAAFRASSDVTTSTEVSSGILDAMVAAADATVAIESNSAAAFVSGSATETLFLRDGRYAHDGLLTYSTELDIASGGVNYSAVEIESVGPVDLSSAQQLTPQVIDEAAVAATVISAAQDELASFGFPISALESVGGVVVNSADLLAGPAIRNGSYEHNGIISYGAGIESLSAALLTNTGQAESSISDNAASADYVAAGAVAESAAPTAGMSAVSDLLADSTASTLLVDASSSTKIEIDSVLELAFLRDGRDLHNGLIGYGAGADIMVALLTDNTAIIDTSSAVDASSSDNEVLALSENVVVSSDASAVLIDYILEQHEATGGADTQIAVSLTGPTQHEVAEGADTSFAVFLVSPTQQEITSAVDISISGLAASHAQLEATLPAETSDALCVVYAGCAESISSNDIQVCAAIFGAISISELAAVDDQSRAISADLFITEIAALGDHGWPSNLRADGVVEVVSLAVYAVSEADCAPELREVSAAIDSISQSFTADGFSQSIAPASESMGGVVSATGVLVEASGPGDVYISLVSGNVSVAELAPSIDSGMSTLLKLTAIAEQISIQDQAACMAYLFTMSSEPGIAVSVQNGLRAADVSSQDYALAGEVAGSSASDGADINEALILSEQNAVSISAASLISEFGALADKPSSARLLIQPIIELCAASDGNGASSACDVSIMAELVGSDGIYSVTAVSAMQRAGSIASDIFISESMLVAAVPEFTASGDSLLGSAAACADIFVPMIAADSASVARLIHAAAADAAQALDSLSALYRAIGTCGANALSSDGVVGMLSTMAAVDAVVFCAESANASRQYVGDLSESAGLSAWLNSLRMPNGFIEEQAVAVDLGFYFDFPAYIIPGRSMRVFGVDRLRHADPSSRTGNEGLPDRIFDVGVSSIIAGSQLPTIPEGVAMRVDSMSRGGNVQPGTRSGTAQQKMRGFSGTQAKRDFERV